MNPMNIHPIFVHFPIALLTLYAILEILPLAAWYPRAAWTDIKTFLVTFGGLGLLVALATGQLAEHSLYALRAENVLRVHKMFAGASTAIFGILAAVYLIHWIFEKHPNLAGGLLKKITLLHAAAQFVLKRPVVVTIATIGLVAIAVTGTLGGIIVYGPNGDFITKFVYSILFS